MKYIKYIYTWLNVTRNPQDVLSKEVEIMSGAEILAINSGRQLLLSQFYLNSQYLSGSQSEDSVKSDTHHSPDSLVLEMTREYNLQLLKTNTCSSKTSDWYLKLRSDVEDSHDMIHLIL